jgi:hypothetical protein
MLLSPHIPSERENPVQTYQKDSGRGCGMNKRVYGVSTIRIPRLYESRVRENRRRTCDVAVIHDWQSHTGKVGRRVGDGKRRTESRRRPGEISRHGASKNNLNDPACSSETSYQYPITARLQDMENVSSKCGHQERTILPVSVKTVSQLVSDD